MNVTLKNDLLSVVISSHGAELQNITNIRTGQEYLWQGDAAFWGRRSPVLFPIVGAVWNNEYRVDGRSYKLGQHGFARDCDFEVVEDVPESEAWFVLESSEATLEKFPFCFPPRDWLFAAGREDRCDVARDQSGQRGDALSDRRSSGIQLSRFLGC